jgi:O-antigen/teichoic acid export membrane protein
MSEPSTVTRPLAGIAARGGIILGAATALENGAQLLRAFLLARILSPSDFGLMGMAFIVIYAGESFSQTGFYRALVQKKDRAEEYLDTVWTVTAIRGAVLTLLVWAIAPWVASFFETPEVTSIVRAISFVFVIQGLQNPALALLERGLLFARHATPQVVSIVCDLALSVALALAFRNVWAMVWGYLIGRAAFVVVSYAVRPYLPRPRISRDQAVEFYRYGRHIFRFTAVDYVIAQADKAMVGKLMGPEPLGLFSFASRLASMPARSLFGIVYRVAFPLFSRIQDETDRLRSAFTRSIGMTALLAAPVYAGLWAVGDDLVRVCLGEQWAEMSDSFRILCLGGPPLALYFLISAALAGIGRPEESAKGTYVFMAALLPGIYPSILGWGIVGAAWCVSLSGTVAFGYLLFAGARAVGCGVLDSLRGAIPAAIASAAMAGALILMRPALGPASWVILTVEILVGSTLYPALVFPLDQAMGAGLLPSLRSMWSTI